MAYILLCISQITYDCDKMDMGMNKDELELLESEEFSSLLEAVEMMARAQGNLSHLTKAVDELKYMVDSGADILPQFDEAVISDIVETMQGLVDSLNEA